jgi:ADP-ribosylglycohydrolase
MQSNKVLDALIGLSVGDALGVPVEFKAREMLKNNPVVGMTGYGVHNQPPGTWSEDSSPAFCLAESLCKGYDLTDIARNFVRWGMQATVNAFVKAYPVIHEVELNRFHRLLENPVGAYEILPLHQYHEAEIASSGYVIHTLEASLWCLLNTNSYAEAVLTAVNMGKDTDTTGCVTGGMASLYYGIAQIPSAWVDAIARKPDIFDLADRLHQKLGDGRE